MASALDVKTILIGSFPPGVESIVDWEDHPGNHIGAIAETIANKLLPSVDELALEVNPITCVKNQSRWERDLAITSPRITTAQRRAVILSRLREVGSVVTIPLVQSVIAPLLDMADASDLVVIESDRDALRTEHTYVWAGSQSISSTPSNVTIHVTDDALVSYAGAQLDIKLTCADLSLLSVTLTGPDSATATVAAGNIGRGALTAQWIRVYFPSVKGAAVGGVFGGNWTIEFALSSGTGTVTDLGLFVEGLGRDSTKHDGLGAAVYHWGVMVEESKIGPNADLVAARSALQRIHYACRPVSLLRRSVGAGALAEGDYAAIPGDPNSLPNASIPGVA